MSGAIKVTRTGDVTRDGVKIGTVRKEMKMGIYATLLGAAASSAGTPYYFPATVDGKELSELGYTTRKAAVARLDKHTRPDSVTDVRVERPWIGDRRFVSATVTIKGHVFGVSRYATESVWVVDFYATPDSLMPVWANGSGSRVTRAHVLKDEAVIAMVDEATATARAELTANA